MVHVHLPLDRAPGTEAELGQNKTVKIIPEITKKQAATLLTHLSIIREGIFIIYAVNNAFNSSHL